MTCGDIFLSFLTGVVSGGYASIVVSKYIAFCNAKTQLLFAVKSIYFEAIGGKYVEVKFISLDTAALWYQEFERLGHVKARDTASDVIKEARKVCERIERVVPHPDSRMPYTPDEMFSFLEKWQQQVSNLSPSFCKIFSPFPKF